MRSHHINDKMLGIAGWYIDTDLCDRIIDIFEKNMHNTHQGMIGVDSVNKDAKDSIDLDFPKYVSEYQEFHDYLDALNLSIEEYKKLYPVCNLDQAEWGINENFNLQKYNPSGGFKSWHTERTGGYSSTRHLVFMTYLNDVTDHGETEWLHQKVKLKPEKGLTVIWSADWYFTHRGIPSPTQTKYIVTGWYGYY